MINNTYTYDGSSGNLNKALHDGIKQVKSLKKASGAQTFAQFINNEPREL